MNIMNFRFNHHRQILPIPMVETVYPISKCILKNTSKFIVELVLS